MRLPNVFQTLDLERSLLDLLPPEAGCWLVGGALRDILRGHAPQDVDLAFSCDPTPIARRLAEKLAGTLVVLDEARQQFRVVVTRNRETHIVDLAPLRAPTLLGDLQRRDFTINAMACDLRSPGRLIDPLGGEKDLAAKALRPCSRGVLVDDPLRMLKGIRHIAELDLTPDRDYLAVLRCRATSLRSVARERLKAELGKIFSHARVERGAELLARFKLLDGAVNLPAEGIPYDETALQQVKAAEAGFTSPRSLAHLSDPVEEHWPVYALVRFWRYLGGATTPNLFPGPLLADLRFSRRGQAIGSMLTGLPRMAPLPAADPATRGAALWLDRFRASPSAAALCLASLAEGNHGVFPLLLETWMNLQVNGRIPDLVGARDLVERFGLLPGKDLGSALEYIREEEISGRIRSVFEAHDVLAERLKKD